ncbi:MAG: hypothetical protein ACI8RD_009787 [Bacillariaceae sp.]|jgi:hypothetical protein
MVGCLLFLVCSFGWFVPLMVAWQYFCVNPRRQSKVKRRKRRSPVIYFIFKNFQNGEMMFSLFLLLVQK